jgi:hypothetical protein
MRLSAYLWHQGFIILNGDYSCYLHMSALKRDLLKHLALLHSVIKETSAVVQYEEQIGIDTEGLG